MLKGVRDTYGPLQEAKFNVNFVSLSSNDKGCTCNPGTPNSTTPASLSATLTVCLKHYEGRSNSLDDKVKESS